MSIQEELTTLDGQATEIFQDSETQARLSHVAREAGDIALVGAFSESSETDGSKLIEFKNKSYITNLPETDSIFVSSENVLQVEGLTSARVNLLTLEGLPDATYWITPNVVSDADPESMVLEVGSNEYGKTINVDFGFHSDVGVSAGWKNMYEQLGFEFKPNNAEYIEPERMPLPTSFVENAKKLGVDVQLISEGHISDAAYLETFRDGKYPVSAIDQYYYTHDIRNDHFTSMVLGGDELKTILSRAGSKGLEDPNDNEAKESHAVAIDYITGMLSQQATELTPGADLRGIANIVREFCLTQEEADTFAIEFARRASELGVARKISAKPDTVSQIPGG